MDHITITELRKEIERKREEPFTDEQFKTLLSGFRKRCQRRGLYSPASVDVAVSLLRFTPLNNGNLNRIKVTEAPNLEFPFFFRNFAAVFENCRRKATSDGQLAHEIAST